MTKPREKTWKELLKDFDWKEDWMCLPAAALFVITVAFTIAMPFILAYLIYLAIQK